MDNRRRICILGGNMRKKTITPEEDRELTRIHNEFRQEHNGRKPTETEFIGAVRDWEQTQRDEHGTGLDTFFNS